MTKIMQSAIYIPHSTVLIKCECPGQSIIEIYLPSRLSFENPTSIVIPRFYDSGCLSKPAVDYYVEIAFANDVFPESTCPITATFKLSIEVNHPMGKGPLKFKLVATYGCARASDIELPHNVINTPVYMPVGTQGTLKAITTE